VAVRFWIGRRGSGRSRYCLAVIKRGNFYCPRRATAGERRAREARVP
jgi:hypothetical protein